MCAQGGGEEEAGENQGGDKQEFAQGGEQPHGAECGVGCVGVKWREDGAPRRSAAPFLGTLLLGASAIYRSG